MDVITEFSRRGGGPTRRPNRASLQTELLQVTIQLAHAQQFPERRRHHETCEARYYQHGKSPVRGPPGDASFEPGQELEAGERASRRGDGDLGKEREEALGDRKSVV